MATEHDLLRHYIASLDAICRAGHATEHSYRDGWPLAGALSPASVVAPPLEAR